MLRTHKFGIRVPKTVEEAFMLDKESGITHWFDAVSLEARNVDVAFQDLEESEKVPVGYQFVRCHMILDVKTGSLKRKARIFHSAGWMLCVKTYFLSTHTKVRNIH
jgi:hypothetical protein